MKDGHLPANLEHMLDRVGDAARDRDGVSFGTILEAVGSRSFGPLLLIAGLITLAPLVGDIPGVPTIIGVFVFLTAAQLLLHRKHFWVPKWLLDRSMQADRLLRALAWLRGPARFVDRFLKPRLPAFTRAAGVYVVAIACLLVSAAMPPMELVPFSANIAGAALAAFGLSLMAQDGLLTLLAFAFTAASVGLAVYGVL